MRFLLAIAGLLCVVGFVCGEVPPAPATAPARVPDRAWLLQQQAELTSLIESAEPQAYQADPLLRAAEEQVAASPELNRKADEHRHEADVWVAAENSQERGRQLVIIEQTAHAILAGGLLAEAKPADLEMLRSYYTAPTPMQDIPPLYHWDERYPGVDYHDPSVFWMLLCADMKNLQPQVKAEWARDIKRYQMPDPVVQYAKARGEARLREEIAEAYLAAKTPKQLQNARQRLRTIESLLQRLEAQTKEK